MQNSLGGDRTRVVQTPWGSLPEWVVAALVLALVLIAFAYPFFLQGKQFSPMDLLYQHYPWRAVTPAGHEIPSNALRWDDAAKYYPVRVNLIREYKQHGISFWQSDQLLGTPNRPTTHWYGSLFYPLTWLFFILPFKTANSLTHILNLYVAGMSMWLLLREHRFSLLPALLGSTVFMLNGFFVVWMSASFLPAMLSLLPLALYLVERLLHTQRATYGLMLALPLAWQFYMGYPPGSIVFWFFFSLYCFISLAHLLFSKERSSALRIVGLLGLSIILAVGLSALFLIPAAQQLTESEYMVARGTGRPGAMPWNALIGFLLPNFWGNPTDGMAYIWYGPENYCEVIAYWGISSLIIASFGLLFRPRRGTIYSFAISSLALALSLGYGLWPLRYLRYLPAVSGVNVTRWHFGIALSGSLFAALGLEYLMKIRQRQRGLSVVLVLLIGLAGGCLSATVLSPGITRARFADYPHLIWAHYWQIGVAAACLVLLAAYLLLHRRVSGTLFGVATLAIVVIDLISFGVGFNPYIASENLYPSTPGIRFLQSQEELYRAVPWGEFPGVFPTYTANAYGISIVTGPDHFREQTYLALLKPLMSEEAQYTAQRNGSVRLNQGLETARQVLDVLNARYLISEPDHPPLGQFATVYFGPDMRIYENPFALPRTWGVCQYDMTTNEEALRRMHQPDFDPQRVALLEEVPALDLDSPSCDPQELKSEVVAYADDEIIIDTEFASPGLLMVSERHEPGWKATLDGQQSDVLRADYLLRAVAVPAGRHTVHLQFRSPIYLWGLGITLCSLVLFCGLSGFIWKGWRGAAAVGLVIPAVTVMWFGRPFTKPLPPAEGWVDADTPKRPSLVPSSQRASLRDEQGEMLLLGYELDKTDVAPGESLRLTLYWQGQSRVGEDYTVFTHLLGEGQQLLAQHDQPPLQGAAPTTSWQEGQIVVDIYRLTVASDAPPGTAHMAVGMYHWLTGERVPLFDDQGNRQMNDWLILNTEIQIQP